MELKNRFQNLERKRKTIKRDFLNIKGLDTFFIEMHD